MRISIIFLILFNTQSYATDISHSLKRPLPSIIASRADCDIYFYNNSNAFNTNLEAMLYEHENKNWEKADKLLDTIVRFSDNDLSLVKNEFQEKLLYCSNLYKFSDEQDYFFELRTQIQLFAMTLKIYNSKQQTCPNIVNNNLSNIVSLSKIIMSSKRKVANKTLQSDP